MGGGTTTNSVRFAPTAAAAYEDEASWMAEESDGGGTCMLEPYDDVSEMSYSASGVGGLSFVSSKYNNNPNSYKLKGQLFAIDTTFHSLDSNKDGLLDRNDMYTFMEQAAKTSRLPMDSFSIKKAVDALMEDVGVGCTRMTKEEFRGLFLRHPDLMKGCFDEELSVVPARNKQRIRGTATTTRITMEERLARDREYRTSAQAWAYLRACWKSHKLTFLWTCLYGLANVMAFSYKAVKYHHNEAATDVFGSCIVVARGSAACLNLNCGLILLPLCRHFLTWLRQTKLLRLIFPFDSVLVYHMRIGLVIALWTIVHVSAHSCDFHRFAQADAIDIEALFGKARFNPLPDTVGGRWKLLLQQRAAITGIIMVVCMLLAYPLLRYRRQNFPMFWISHHLLLVMLVALLFHGTGNLLEPFQSVYWVGGPLLLYLIPRLWRETPFSKQETLGVTLKDGGIVCLRLERPNTWDNDVVKAGMYAFINVPQISRYEWHPFTLTSSPQDKNYIEFHISKAGDWTTKLHELVEKSVQEHDQSSTRALCPEGGAEIAPRTEIVVKVEGPMGAPSQDYTDYPVVVLVGAGIGVTPMISILKQVLADQSQTTKLCYLYWTTRDHAAFEWFSRLMADIFDANSNSSTHHIHIRHFLTSVKDDPRDMGAILLHHATRTKHEKTNFDMIQGNYAHHPVESGRPYWKEELESVRADAKEIDCRECGIFLCGPEKMADTVEQASFALSKNDPDFFFHFSKETF